MKPFALTSKAKADLKAIATFTEERWGKAQRNLYLKQFDDAFHKLADAPLAGKTCDYIRSGYRKFSQGNLEKVGVIQCGLSESGPLANGLEKIDKHSVRVRLSRCLQRLVQAFHLL
jgi:toxin ParE1/3/4